MERFAFIFHPHDIESLGDWVLAEPRLKQKRRRLTERSLRWFPPFKRETVTGIRSLTGKEIEGDMILWPMIPEQIINMNSEFTVAKLIEAGKLAERLGAKLVGLGAYAAWIGKRGVLLSEAINIPVTTGTSYTIAVAVEATLKAATLVGIDLPRSTIAIIGATGMIGQVCAQILVNNIGRLILVARHEGKLIELANRINGASSRVLFSSNIQGSVAEADVVLICTSVPKPLLTLKDIRPGSVVCDISLPHNILKSEADEASDVLMIDGGIVKPPGDVEFHFFFGLKKGLVYACMAETMLLTLEEKYTSYSLGGSVSIQKVSEVAQLAKKHGFTLAEFTSFGSLVPEQRFEEVKQVRIIKGIRKKCQSTPSHL